MCALQRSPNSLTLPCALGPISWPNFLPVFHPLILSLGISFVRPTSLQCLPLPHLHIDMEEESDGWNLNAWKLTTFSGNNKSFSEWFPVYSTFPLFILTSNFFLKLGQMCCLTTKSFKIGITLVFENHKTVFHLRQNSSISHIQIDLSQPMNYLTKL